MVFPQPSNQFHNLPVISITCSNSYESGSRLLNLISQSGFIIAYILPFFIYFHLMLPLSYLFQTKYHFYLEYTTCPPHSISISRHVFEYRTALYENRLYSQIRRKIKLQRMGNTMHEFCEMSEYWRYMLGQISQFAQPLKRIQ